MITKKINAVLLEIQRVPFADGSIGDKFVFCTGKDQYCAYFGKQGTAKHFEDKVVGDHFSFDQDFADCAEEVTLYGNVNEDKTKWNVTLESYAE